MLSIHEFYKRLKKGEVNAIELLFSMFHTESTIYGWQPDIELMKSHYKMFVTKDMNGFIGFCMGHLHKNDIFPKKQKELEILSKRITDYSFVDTRDLALCNIIYKKKFFENLKMCKLNNKNGKGWVEIYGKKFPDLDLAFNLQKWLVDEIEKCKKPIKPKKLQWKQIMHAVRMLFEVKCLLEEGKINFPLKESNFLLEIRRGQISYIGVIECVQELLEELEIKIEKSDLPEKIDVDKADDVFYEILRELL